MVDFKDSPVAMDRNGQSKNRLLKNSGLGLGWLFSSAIIVSFTWKQMKEHLVVLIHGLQGNVGHMVYLEKKLSDLNPNILSLNAKANDQGDQIIVSN